MTDITDDLSVAEAVIRQGHRTAKYHLRFKGSERTVCGRKLGGVVRVVNRPIDPLKCKHCWQSTWNPNQADEDGDKITGTRMSVLDSVEIGGIIFEPKWLEGASEIEIMVKPSSGEPSVRASGDRGAAHLVFDIRVWEKFQEGVDASRQKD